MGTITFRAPEASVGRDPASALVVLDPAISRTHALLRRTADGWWLSVVPRVTHDDLVRHNGVVVPPGGRTLLASADRIQFGRSPRYEVCLDGDALLLAFSDETEPPERAPDPSRPLRLAVDRLADLPEHIRGLGEWCELRRIAVEEPVDAVVVTTRSGAAARRIVERARAASFFVPIVVLGVPEAGQPRRIGAAYLYARPGDDHLPSRIAALVRDAGRRERAALPSRTGEILYLDPAEQRVRGHDWLRGVPRELRLSELQHRIVLCIALAQRRRPGMTGLQLGEVVDELERRGSARSDRTVGNELSVRLPRALLAASLHPALYAVIGTREKTYGLSTPASCLRDFVTSPPR
ncbi:MAG: FHA domain-containing protein [Acidobacteriota bacterium]